jgi:hypothetical protein
MMYLGYEPIVENFNHLSVVPFQSLIMVVEWLFICDSLVKIQLQERHGDSPHISFRSVTIVRISTPTCHLGIVLE